MTGCGRGWRRSWAAAGRRRPSAAGCASCSPATMPCACARRPSTDGSIPASRAANAGPDACRAATGGGASMRAVGCRGSLIPGRVSIAERPPEADDRSGFGHWEADSVIGMGCDLHTEVERRTRFLMARVIPDKTAERSVGARLAMFAPLPAAARLSVTHDNGTGFARHARLRDEPGMATCFADPYSSWQRAATRTGTA